MSDVKPLYIKRKDKMDRYSLKEGKVKSSYAREYINKKKPQKIELVYKPPIQYQMKQENVILNDAWVINLRKSEDVRQETKQSNNEVQHSQISGTIMAMQDVSGKKSGRKRKARDSKKSDEIQNKQG